MIDPDNLRTASLYINNQLLSRGLLRDGQSIDFADPEGTEGGLPATMGRIMSVVNDLILRRDRDAEHRESLSSTLRTLRADYQRQTTEFVRQTERLSETQRQLDIADATERALRTQLKTAEQGIQKLKEETAKMKSLVAQTRSACANEVRKRDRQIDTLKKAVADAGRVRGAGRSRDVITISVTGEFTGEGEDGMGMPVGATENEGYSLRMETNGFLTALAKGLSEENEGLLTLVRHTVEGLREMSGLDRNTGSSHEQGSHSHVGDDLIMRPLQKSAEELAAELEAIVEHLRSILTNPSFVPIEEVEVRDDIITQLREGLETMEARWKDAVHMIDGWRRRMVSSGKSVDMEDLQMGLRLSPVRVRDVEETANVEPMRLSCVQEEDEEEDVGDHQHQDEKPGPRRFGSRSPESLRLVPASNSEGEELGDDDSDSDSSIFQDDLDDDDLDVEEPNVQILQISTAESIDSSPLPEPPQISPLKDSYSSGNRGAGPKQHSKKAGDFTPITEEETKDLAAEEKADIAPTSRPVSPNQESMKSPQVDGELPSYTASYDSPLFGKSGERPSQNRKLFSKPPSLSTELRARNVGGRNRGGKESPPPTRTTRSAAKRSAETSPVTGQKARRTAMDPDARAAPTSAANVAAAPPISSASAAVPNQETEVAQRNTSANSSSSSSSDNKQASARKRPNHRSPTRPQPPPSSSRLPRRHAQQSPLNMAAIAAKLAASEREADAARVRAKLKAVRRNRRVSGEAARDQDRTEQEAVPETGGQKEEPEQEQQQQQTEGDVDPIKRDVGSPAKSHAKSPVKKGPRRRWSRGVGADDFDELAYDGATDAKDAEPARDSGAENWVEERGDVGLKITKRRRAPRASKAACRRRSTLSPWELQGLISGNVGGVESPAR